MTRLTVAKIVVAALGLVIFAYGLRINDANVRWFGIGVVLVAWLLRFLGRSAPR